MSMSPLLNRMRDQAGPSPLQTHRYLHRQQTGGYVVSNPFGGSKGGDKRMARPVNQETENVSSAKGKHANQKWVFKQNKSSPKLPPLRMPSPEREDIVVERTVSSARSASSSARTPLFERLSRPKHPFHLTLDPNNFLTRRSSPSPRAPDNMPMTARPAANSARAKKGIASDHHHKQMQSALKNIRMRSNLKRGGSVVRWNRKRPMGPSKRNHVDGSKEDRDDASASLAALPTAFQSVSSIHGFLMQKDIKALLKQTNYDRRELYVMYVRFKALCSLSPTPDGIDASTFKKGVARLAVEDDLFVDRVFDLVDEDGSGSIEWDEFLAAMSALEKGSLSKKLQFFFRTYDVDGDGYISKQDLATMFLSSSMLEPDQVTHDLVDAFVDRVFMFLGASNKEKLSITDVQQYMASKTGDEDVWEVFGRSMLKDFGAGSD